MLAGRQAEASWARPLAVHGGVKLKQGQKWSGQKRKIHDEAPTVGVWGKPSSHPGE